MSTLIISNEKMVHIMKIVKSLIESDLFMKGARETTKIYPKEQKRGFFGMLLGTSGASFLWNLLAGIVVNWTGKKVIRARQDF